VLGEAWELFEMAFGTQSEQVGNCYIEIAGVHNKKKDIEEVEELENTLHGDRSVNVAKTYKVIGTLFMICNPPKPQEAKEYL